MKKLLSLFLFSSVAFIQTINAQDTAQQHQLSQLLSNYYDIKNALVTGNSEQASSSAQAFVKTANTIDYKVISEGNINALLKDATPISESKDLKKQRDHFSNLSNNMTALAKSVKLSTEPIYQAYCPMKKAGWLSKEKGIKNPYYGNAMLTCGSVVETIQ